MTEAAFPVVPPPTLEQAATRAFAIHQLWREGAVDRTAALFSLAALHESSRHAGLRWLCLRIAEVIGGIPLRTPASAEHDAA